jgi:LacI family transcriptional regulator
MTIGVLTQIIGSPFYDTISQGVIAGLSGTGYSPIFADGRWNRIAEAEAIDTLVSRRVDGLVLIGGDVPEDDITKLCAQLPTVLAARKTELPEHNCIYMDNVAGGFDATSHLIEHGHQSIAFIQGVEHHPDAIDRFTGYKDALRKNGIAVNSELVLHGDFSAESGAAAVETLIAGKTQFSAIFAANDIAAFGARLALHRHGLRVPDDISLVGFDDQMESAYMTPPLTTVRQPAREMGQSASAAVLDLIDGQPFESQMYPGQLQARESVSLLQG